MRLNTLCGIFAFLPLTSASVVTLTDDNFEVLTAGKIAFVKFFAPWCGHCKAMASDWESLAEQFTTGDIIIAEADCTADDIGSICDDNSIQGFPTLKYGDFGALEDYDGGRDLDSLIEHASTLGPTCSPANLDLCDAEEKRAIEAYNDMTDAEIAEALDGADLKIQEEDEKLSKLVEGLSTKYEEMSGKFEEGQKLKKETMDYKLIKSIAEMKDDRPPGMRGDDDDDDDMDDDDDDDDDMQDDDDDE